MIEWEIEDYLGENMVFLNGFRDEDTRASLGAYGTVISFSNLAKAYKESPYTKDQWIKFIDYTEGNEYLGPTFKLLKITLQRLMNEKL